MFLGRFSTIAFENTKYKGNTMPKLKLCFAIAFFCLMPILSIGQDFYDINTVREIRITFAESNWDEILDRLYDQGEERLIAAETTIDGVSFDSVGVKYKGFSTYDPNNAKNPLNIKLDTILRDQKHEGFYTFKLANGSFDVSFIREALSYEIFRKYMAAPLANFVKIYINGNYHGLYTNVESVNNAFLRKHFYSAGNSFFKCDPILTGGPGPGGPGGNAASLQYLGSDPSDYYDSYEIKSDDGWEDLVNLITVLDQNPDNIEEVLDTDRALWMLALNHVLVHLDSYTGHSRNYYLYLDNNSRFNPVAWDFNMSFGVYPRNISGSLSLTDKQELDPFSNINFPECPLVSQLFQSDIYRKMYIAHMRTIVNENFANGLYETRALAMQDVVDQAYQDDPNKLFTYADFKANVYSTINAGRLAAPGLVELMADRVIYLQNHSEFQKSAPGISDIQALPGNPNLNEMLWITAELANAENVYLGYRFNQTDVFEKVEMFDDGAHQDGSAGDGVYGGSLTALSAMMQYYIYAENADAGMFSPERAEHEFYELQISVPAINVGDIVINEFLASNDSSHADPNGDYDDWLELYNTTGEAIALNGLYLTDDFGNPLKWQIPANTTIAANDFLLIWADEDGGQGPEHANFKLAAPGEEIMLILADSTVLDSLTYGQQTSDISFGRYPEGSATWQFFDTTTPGSANGVVTGIAYESFTPKGFSLSQNYPNPFNPSTIIQFSIGKAGVVRLNIYNVLGQQIETLLDEWREPGSYRVTFDASKLSGGAYFYRLSTGDYRVEKMMLLLR